MTEATSPAAILAGLERKRVAAMVAADIDTLDELLHDDMVFGHTNGHVDDKQTYLAKFKAGAVRYFDTVQQIETVGVFGDTGLVHFHLKMRAELATGSRQLNVVALTVWTQEQGRWRLVAHQPTVVDFDPAA